MCMWEYSVVPNSIRSAYAYNTFYELKLVNISWITIHDGGTQAMLQLAHPEKCCFEPVLRISKLFVIHHVM